MSKNIKNYTSSVSVERTISAIEQELVKIGVTHIEKRYENGLPTAIMFSIMFKTEILCFKVPVNPEAAYDIIKSIPGYKSKSKDWLKAQSYRTAWRIVLNWVEVQVAMVQLRQADAMEVFLPYAYDQSSNTTLFEKLKGENFKMLSH